MLTFLLSGLLAHAQSYPPVHCTFNTSLSSFYYSEFDLPAIKPDGSTETLHRYDVQPDPFRPYTFGIVAGFVAGGFHMELFESTFKYHVVASGSAQISPNGFYLNAVGVTSHGDDMSATCTTP